MAGVHDDGVVGPSGADDGAAGVIQAEVVKEAGYALGDSAQDGARRDVPNDDFGSEEKADIEYMPLLVEPQAVGRPQPLQNECGSVSAGVDFVDNTGSGLKVSLGGGVQQARGVVAREAVAHGLRRGFKGCQVGEGGGHLRRCAVRR